MGGNNLPDDVSPSDIDDNFDEPSKKVVQGTVHVAVEVEVPENMDEREVHTELAENFKGGEVIHTEVK